MRSSTRLSALKPDPRATSAWTLRSSSAAPARSVTDSATCAPTKRPLRRLAPESAWARLRRRDHARRPASRASRAASRTATPPQRAAEHVKQNSAVDGDLVTRGSSGASERSPPWLHRRPQPIPAADHCEYRRLRQAPVRARVPTRCAERQSDRELPTARRAARARKQRRDVGAGDQQQHGHRAEQQPQRRPGRRRPPVFSD